MTNANTRRRSIMKEEDSPLLAQERASAKDHPSSQGPASVFIREGCVPNTRPEPRQIIPSIHCFRCLIRPTKGSNTSEDNNLKYLIRLPDLFGVEVLKRKIQVEKQMKS